MKICEFWIFFWVILIKSGLFPVIVTILVFVRMNDGVKFCNLFERIFGLVELITDDIN